LTSGEGGDTKKHNMSSKDGTFLQNGNQTEVDKMNDKCIDFILKEVGSIKRIQDRVKHLLATKKAK